MSTQTNVKQWQTTKYCITVFTKLVIAGVAGVALIQKFVDFLPDRWEIVGLKDWAVDYNDISVIPINLFFKL